MVLGCRWMWCVIGGCRWSVVVSDHGWSLFVLVVGGRCWMLVVVSGCWWSSVVGVKCWCWWLVVGGRVFMVVCCCRVRRSPCSPPRSWSAVSVVFTSQLRAVRQWYGSLDDSAGALGCVDDFSRGLVNQFVIKRLEADTYFLFG